MFGRYFAMRDKAKDLPTVEVDEKEFVEAMIVDGKTEKEARFQATVSKGLGGACMVGERMLKIVDK